MIKAIITQREELNQHGDLIDSLEKNYIDYFSSMGILAIPISSFTDNVENVVETIKPELIILSGGGILPKDAYNFKKEGFQQINRNRVETKLIDIALEKDIALLGICRGMQMLAYYFGGKIDDFRNLEVPRKIGENHKAVVLDSGTELEVNNFHNDGLFAAKLPNSLNDLIVDNDNNTVETFKSKSKQLIGVQWHPERVLSQKYANKYLQNIIKNALIK